MRILAIAVLLAAVIALGGGIHMAEAVPTISVKYLNNVPLTTSPEVDESTTLRLSVSTSNTAGDVTYSINPPLSGARIHPDTGHLVYVPERTHAGPQTITIVATDDTGPASMMINVTVGESIAQVVSINVHDTDKAQATVIKEATDLKVRFRSITGTTTPTTHSNEGSVVNDGPRTFLSNSIPDPAENTVYYLEIKDRATFLSHKDIHIYAQFTPGINGTKIIPNPNTRPGPVAPTFDQEVETNVPRTIMPALVGMDGDPPAITAATTDGSKGMADHTDTTITYTPNAGASGQDTITYTVTDDKGQTATAMIHIEIPDLPLVAVDDPDVTVDEDDSVNIDVTANDMAVDATVSVPVQPANGNAVREDNNTITYRPNQHYNGPDSFQYVITRDGESQNATVTIDVRPVDDQLTFTMPENTPGQDHIIINELEPYSFAAEVTNPDNVTYSFTIELGDPPATGANITQAGNFSWTPAEEHGPGVYTVTIILAPEGRDRVRQQITFSVDDINSPPIITSPPHQEAQTYTRFEFPIDARDTDIPVQDLQYAIFGDETSDARIIDGTLVWIPRERHVGEQSFRVRVDDGRPLFDLDESQLRYDSHTGECVYDGRISSAFDESRLRYDPFLVKCVYDGFVSSAFDEVRVNITVTSSVIVRPIIALEGANPQIIELGENYTEMGAIVQDDDPNYEGRYAADTSRLDLDSVGQYPVTYSAPPDAAGNEPLNVTRTVRVQDTVAPAIRLAGQNPQTIAINSTYVDLGVTVTDNDPAYAETVTTDDSDVNTGTAGNYTVTYTAPSDAAGNAPEQVTRRVQVKQLTGVDNMPPVARNSSIDVFEDIHETFRHNATDTDGEVTITAVGNASKGTATHNATDITYFPHRNAHGPDMFTYMVTDDRGDSATGTINIMIEENPDSPRFVGLRDRFIPELVPYTLTIEATDEDTPDEDLRFSIDIRDKPPGVQITEQGVLTWTPTEAQGPGLYTFPVDVSDGDDDPGELISFRVLEVNKPPAFDDIDAGLLNTTVGMSYSLDLNATDSDLPSQTVSYEFLSLDGPSENTTTPAINGTTGLITWTPDTAGVHTIHVEARDDFNPPGINITDITVNVLTEDGQLPVDMSDSNETMAPNQNPVLESIDDVEVMPGEEVRVTVTARDPDGDDELLRYSFGNAELPPDAIDPDNGTITWVPTADDAGRHTVIVVVTDLAGDSDSENFTINVVLENRDPVFQDIEPQDIDVGMTVSALAVADDPDGDPVTYGLGGTPPANASITRSGSFTWTPTVDQAGYHNITITADDGRGGAASKNFSVTVRTINQDPTINDIPPQTVEVGQSIDFQIDADDADIPKQTLTYRLTGTIQAGTDINATGYFSWMPTGAQAGHHNITITVEDGHGRSASTSFGVTVKTVNQDPTIDKIDPQIIAFDHLINFTIVARDVDVPKQNLTYSLTGTVPEGATINSTTGDFDWIPTSSQIAHHILTVTVTDGEGGSASRNFTITVSTVNQNPVVDDVNPIAVDPDQNINFQINATDTDRPPQTLTYSLTTTVPGASINATTGYFDWTPTIVQAGMHPITVNVDDGNGGSASITFTITVIGPTGPNQNPVAPDILINAELFFPSAVTPAVTDPDGDNVTITRVTGATLGTLDTSMLPQISYTPNQTGIDRLSYVASDGRRGTDTGTITIFINPDGNARPALDHIYNVGGRVGTDLEFTATADDSDDTSLTFDIANAPDGASITPGGDFSWRPSESENGTHTVTFIVYDDSGGADWQHVAVTILRENETNLPPVPQDIDAGVVLGGGRGFQPDIADPEGDVTEITRVYDSSLGDVDRSFMSQGIIVYVAGVLGNDEVIYTVSDGRGGLANGTLSITVEEPANVRPLIEFVGDKSVNAGDELTFTVDADDLDGFVVDFGLEGDTQGPSMSPFGVFSWTPTANDVGRHQFTILVFDDAGDNSTVTIAVTVRPEDHVNSPPVAPDVVITTSQDVLSIVRPTLTDPDEGDPVRISQTGNTAKGSILSGFLRAGIIIYLPDQGETGTETIPYTVSDSSDDTDTATINVFISARGNTDPILGSIDFRNINAGDPLAFDLEAEDPDGDTVSYLLVGAPGNTAISSDGAFSWMPTAADVGNHTFTVIAYDDRGGADSKTAVIRVLPAGTANQAPNAPDSTVTAAPGGSVVITPAISDPDGDRVTITDAVASGTGVVIQSEDSINYIHVATTPTETVTYTVTDARGAVSTGTITITVEN